LIFAVAPLLSSRLGDFWSSFIFLPFWGLIYTLIWLTRKYVVRPRMGEVKFSPVRNARLKRFSILMIIINLLALILGIIAVLQFGYISGMVFPILFGVILLVGFSLAAYLLDFPRLYVYGLLMFLVPLVGEWLYQNKGASHHGYPITYGFVSAVMIVTGIMVFVRFLKNNPAIQLEGLQDEQS
jgi:hypothetical protein